MAQQGEVAPLVGHDVEERQLAEAAARPRPGAGRPAVGPSEPPGQVGLDQQVGLDEPLAVGGPTTQATTPGPAAAVGPAEAASAMPRARKTVKDRSGRTGPVFDAPCVCRVPPFG